MVPALRRQAVAAVSIAAIAVFVSGCSSSGASPSPSAVGQSPAVSQAPAASGGAGTVQVTLQEWAVVPAPTSATAGPVTFQVTNKGPEDVHEFVVLKTDLDPGALPVDANGAVAESGAGMTVSGEIEDITVGQTQSLPLTLAAGKYVLLCNIYDTTEKEAHYKMGMRTPFEVK